MKDKELRKIREDFISSIEAKIPEEYVNTEDQEAFRKGYEYGFNMAWLGVLRAKALDHEALKLFMYTSSE